MFLIPSVGLTGCTGSSSFGLHLHGRMHRRVFFRSIDLTDALAGSLLALAMQSPMHCPFIFNIIGFTRHLISADARPIRLGCHLDTSNIFSLEFHYDLDILTTNCTSWIC